MKTQTAAPAIKIIMMAFYKQYKSRKQLIKGVASFVDDGYFVLHSGIMNSKDYVLMYHAKSHNKILLKVL